MENFRVRRNASNPPRLLIENMYRRMQKEENRLRSFSTRGHPWPNTNVDVRELARAGFFYLLAGDRTVCAFCRAGLSDWQSDDVPFAQHELYYPDCPFVRGLDVGNVPITPQPNEVVTTVTEEQVRPTIAEEQTGQPSTSIAEEQTGQPSTSLAESATNELPKEEERNQTTMCKICLDKDIDFVFLPCGHLVACKGCSWYIEDCPICKANIVARFQVYFT